MTTTSLSNADRRATGLALVLAPLAALVSTLVLPTFDRTDKAEELTTVASHSGAWETGSLLAMVAGVLLIPAALALGRLPEHEGSKVARIGAVLMVLGAVGQFTINALGFVLLAIAERSTSLSDKIALVEQVESTTGFGIVLAMLMVGMTAGIVAIAAGLLRAGIGPRWAPLAMIASQILIAATPPAAPAAVRAAGFALMLVAFASYGIRLLDWRAPRRVADAPAAA